MAENWGEDVGITEDLISLVDSRIPSLDTRARRVYVRLHDFSKWDLICFSLSYLASVIPLFPMFGPPVKSLGQMSFLIHYLHPEQIDENYSELVNGSKNVAGKSDEN